LNCLYCCRYQYSNKFMVYPNPINRPNIQVRGGRATQGVGRGQGGLVWCRARLNARTPGVGDVLTLQGQDTSDHLWISSGCVCSRFLGRHQGYNPYTFIHSPLTPYTHSRLPLWCLLLLSQVPRDSKGLMANKDGGVTIYVSAAPPGPKGSLAYTNWLPSGPYPVRGVCGGGGGWGRRGAGAGEGGGTMGVLDCMEGHMPQMYWRPCFLTLVDPTTGVGRLAGLM
jgi:hypothetical protein